MALGVQAVLGYELLTDLVDDIQAIFAGELNPERREGATILHVEERGTTDTDLLQLRLDDASRPLGPGLDCWEG